MNHLNPVDEAMIADASCRLVAGESFQIFDSKAMVACCQYYVAVHKTLQWGDSSLLKLCSFSVNSVIYLATRKLLPIKIIASRDQRLVK